MSRDAAAESLSAELAEHALSTARAAGLRAAVTLGLPEALGEDATTVDELAVAVGANPAALHRLLRSLSSHGVFAEVRDGCFAHTDKSAALRADAPNSLEHLVLWCTEPWTWSLWGDLDTAVRTGSEVFTRRYGRKFYQHLHAEWPESAEVFDRAMTQQSRSAAAAITDMLDLDGVRTIADVGAGQGTVLAALLERHPETRGFLLDLPHVVANADARFQAGGALADRVRLSPCDCLEEVPARAELYLLKNILGTDDDNAVRILRNVVRAALPGARVVIVENLIDDGPRRKLATAMDLRMLLVMGGRKHTEAGLLEIVAKADLTVREKRAVDSDLRMIEATVPG